MSSAVAWRPGMLAAVPLHPSIEWSKESLEQGSRLAQMIEARIDPVKTRAYGIIPQAAAEDTPRAFSHSARIGDADRILGLILRDLAAMDNALLVVDDDLARRGDRRLDDASFVDDRVVRSASLNAPSGDLTRLIRRGASGYPLNAFVCELSDADEAPARLGQMPESAVSLLAETARIVIHSIYDAESFLLLTLDERADSFLSRRVG